MPRHRDWLVDRVLEEFSDRACRRHRADATVGQSHFRSSDRFRLHTLFEKGIAVSGFTLGLWIDARLPAVAAAAERVLRFAEDGRIAPVIGRVFPADEVADAHRLFESRATVGRVVVTF